MWFLAFGKEKKNEKGEKMNKEVAWHWIRTLDPCVPRTRSATCSHRAALELTHGTHGILPWVPTPIAVMPSKYVLYRRQSLAVPFNEVAVGALAGQPCPFMIIKSLTSTG